MIWKPNVVVAAIIERQLDHGILRAVWMTPDEIRAARQRHRSPQVERCLNDYLSGTRYSLALLRDLA